MLTAVLLVLSTLAPGGGATLLAVLSSVLTDPHLPDDVLKIAVNTCEALPFELFFSKTREEPADISINLFTHSARKVYRIRDVRRLLLENPKLNSKRQTTIYVHGWRNHPLDESTQAITKALVDKDHNVIAIDASKYMSDLYLAASSHVVRIGEALNKFLVRITERVPVDKINLIGFSLGAHICGVAGKLFRRQTRMSIERITALDPAKPCFEHLDYQRLGREDANYVDVIHTNTGTLGLKEAIGHADFYVNGLSGNQPECRGKVIKLECNHAQAWKLFVLSMTNERGVLATKCGSWEELRQDRCRGGEAVVGYGSSASNRGLYYVRTGRKLIRKQRYSERNGRRRKSRFLLR